MSQVGAPATRPGLLDPSAPDVAVLLAAAARYGIEILAPSEPRRRPVPTRAPAARHAERAATFGGSITPLCP